MRQERTVQCSIFDLFAEHEIGRELKAMSRWLDEHRDLLELVAGDLRRHGVKETGRQGLPAEAVLRCALLKQYRQLSLYEERQCGTVVRVTFFAFRRLLRHPRSEPDCKTRLVAKPDPTYIRSLLETAEPTSRLRRTRAQEDETILSSGV
jgi:IS5 family transposase